MATKILDPPLVTAEEFLAMDFGEHKAELANGIIRLMAGGTRRHARVQTNILVALGTRLRGTGCAPYASDMAVRTHDRSIRYPDVTVYCGHENSEDDDALALNDPHIIFEIMSAGTARTDLREKLPEYKALPSVETVVHVDLAVEQLRVFQRLGVDDWNERGLEPKAILVLPSLSIDIPHTEIFARD